MFSLLHVSGGNTDSLFSENTFRTHMVPRLLPLFCVRDIQIRMILLSHFSAYCSLFSQNQLQTRVLPEVTYLLTHNMHLLDISLKHLRNVFISVSIVCEISMSLNLIYNVK